MQQNVRRARHWTACLTIIVLGGAALATAVGVTPSIVQARASTLTDRRPTRAPLNSSKTVNLKHRHTVHVNIHNLAFGPARIVVSPGTTIVWTNQDGFQHTTTSDKGLWDSGPIDPTASFKRVFKKTGTFTYHCTIHPFMLGTITVAE
jgi:plastocyanin